MRIMPRALLGASLCFCSPSTFAQASNVCDLNHDGIVDIKDVQLAVNMSLGLRSCTANILGLGVCNRHIVERIKAAALGRLCNTHYVALSWTANTSRNIVGYNIYRGRTPGGPYTKLNTSLLVETRHIDPSAAPGQTYYYVTTAVDNVNRESSYSNETKAVVPTM